MCETYMDVGQKKKATVQQSKSLSDFVVWEILEYMLVTKLKLNKMEQYQEE